MFNDIVMDHFKNPRNAGDLPGQNVSVEVTNPVCGDILRLAVRMEGDRIIEVRFKTQGCVAAIAASSMLTGLLGGKSKQQAREITAQSLSSSLGGLPPATIHAAQLCVDGVAALLRKCPVAS